MLQFEIEFVDVKQNKLFIPNSFENQTTATISESKQCG